MSDTTTIGERPAPYRVAQIQEWIICEEPECPGLAVLVRTSITNAEQVALNARHDDIAGSFTEAWLALPPDERDMTNSPRMRERALLAPYVLDWNAVGVTEDGQEAPLPAPSVAGPEVFDAISAAEYTWISRIVLIGYLATGKAGGSRTRSGKPGNRFGPQSARDAA